MQLDLFTQITNQEHEYNLEDPRVRGQIIRLLEERSRYKMELFYTITEVGSLLGLTYFQVFTLCKWFRIVPVKVHKLVRIPVQEIIEYLREYDRIRELEGNYYTWMNSRTKYPLSPAFGDATSTDDGIYAS